MAPITGKTELLAVFGNPISHTLSPAMHNALLEHLHIPAVYVPVCPSADSLREAIQGFRAMRFRGANVTIPFKEAVIPFLDELSPVSAFTQSVNTLYWKDGVIGGTLMGTTTDPYGALRNLEEHGILVRGKRVALLGSGGAARAIAFALLEKSAKLTIVCRDSAKGNVLVQKLNEVFPENQNPVSFCAFSDFEKIFPKIEVVINATSVGMSPNNNESPLSAHTIHSGMTVYDIVYNPEKTKLLQDAAARGCKAIGGKGMLVHQGAVSFEYWFPGYQADISVMKQAIGL
ncbi:MAG: shikimate dehydrogenase [Fibrobacter sp.]|nr:shikimate dehydrogenase [Fibrobacter sp.]